MKSSVAEKILAAAASIVTTMYVTNMEHVGYFAIPTILWTCSCCSIASSMNAGTALRESVKPIFGQRFATPVSQGIILRETRRPVDGPLQAVRLHDSFHGQRIVHVISHDETGDPIGNSREVRRRGENLSSTQMR